MVENYTSFSDFSLLVIKNGQISESEKKRQIGKRVQWFLGKTPRGGVFFELSSKNWCFSKEKKTHPQNFVLLKYLLNIENTSGGVFFFLSQPYLKSEKKKTHPPGGFPEEPSVDLSLERQMTIFQMRKKRLNKNQ